MEKRFDANRTTFEPHESLIPFDIKRQEGHCESTGEHPDASPDSEPSIKAALQQLASQDLSPLCYGKAEFVLRAEEDAKLPAYLGSTLRGSLGHALRKVACLPLCRDTTTCILKERCAYAYCFETHLPKTSNVLRGLEHIPHPLVIEPPQERSAPTWSKGEELRFSLVLVGRAMEFFPYFVAAADRMAALGLGKARGRFRLVEVLESQKTPSADGSKDSRRRLWSGSDSRIESLGSHSIQNRDGSSDRIEMEFTTPLRLVVKGRVSTAISFRDLMRALLARISSLVYFHCSGELNVDFRKILEAASYVTAKESSLHVKPLSRWSNRQQAALRLDGLIGKITFVGETVPAFMDLLQAGEIFHVGKGTVFGLGKYRIIPAERT